MRSGADDNHFLVVRMKKPHPNDHLGMGRDNKEDRTELVYAARLPHKANKVGTTVYMIRTWMTLPCK